MVEWVIGKKMVVWAVLWVGFILYVAGERGVGKWVVWLVCTGVAVPLYQHGVEDHLGHGSDQRCASTKHDFNCVFSSSSDGC